MCVGQSVTHTATATAAPIARERDERFNLVFGLMLLSNNWQERRGSVDGGGVESRARRRGEVM